MEKIQMKNLHKILALLLVAALLLCGCASKKQEEQAKMDSLIEGVEGSFGSGDLLFIGKVLGRAAEDRLITFYDADMGKNTFYSVEITEDLYGYMPDRVITVAVLGNSETFPDRTLLSKGGEYYFRAHPWVEGEDVIFLLPTFYTSLAEREEGMIYTTIGDVRYQCGSEEDFLKAIKEAEERAEYGLSRVWRCTEESLAAAYGRSTVEQMEELKIAVKDPQTLKKTEERAYQLMQKMKNAEKSREGLGELFE